MGIESEEWQKGRDFALDLLGLSDDDLVQELVQMEKIAGIFE